MNSYGLKIDSAKPTGIFADVKSPYDGQVVAKVEKPDRPALEQALTNAKATFYEVMRNMPAWRRAEILHCVADQIRAHHEELALTIACEGGKPLKDARVEVTRAINTTKMSADEALRLNGEQLTMDRAVGTEAHLALTLREPVGPVLAISAFNHPVNLICHQVCTAFAAGNSVLVKPASQTPVSCFRILEFFEEAGVPPGVLNLTNASGAETTPLVQDKRIRFITFIGGEDVGWQLQKQVQPGVRMALEHGGTAAAIVDNDANLETAMPSIVRAAFYHAGQVCVSTQNLYVHEALYDAVIGELEARVPQLVTGDPTDASTDVGPLISRVDVERVGSWVAEAKGQGARVLVGGKQLSESCYAPTVLIETVPDMTVMAKEVFGPVLNVRRYRDLSAAIAEINDSPYAFQAAIYTRDVNKGLYAARQVDAKAFMVNDSTAFRVDWMPFGGKKASGLGAGGVRHSIYDMTDEKLVVIKTENDWRSR